jgi:hypothetical protein
MTIRYAIHTRQSTEERLKQQFNCLANQRLVGENYVLNQPSEGREVVKKCYEAATAAETKTGQACRNCSGIWSQNSC